MANTINIYPSADSYVDIQYPGSNYGTSGTLLVGSTTAFLTVYYKEAYMRFLLSQIPTNAIISSAKLYLYNTYQANNTFLISNISTANRTWTETGITWNNKPAYDTTYPNKRTGGVGTNAWSTTDITSYVKDQFNQGVAAEFTLSNSPCNGCIDYFVSKDSTDTTHRPYIQVTYDLGNRIYVNSYDPTATPKWDYQSYPGFMYDLNANGHTETLTINNSMGNLNSGRTINPGQLSYNTGRTIIYFPVYKANGLLVNGASTYPAVGFKGEKWVAINNKVNKIARLVIQQEYSASDKKTFQVGETWTIGAGYTLTANTIDVTTTPRQVNFTLARNGITLITTTVAQSAQLTFTQTVLGEANQTVFSTYVDSIFAGATSNMCQIRYTWLIDAGNALTIANGNIIDAFTVNTATVDSIAMSNTNSISLSGAKTKTKIFGATSQNINLVTVDSTTDLKIYLDTEYTGQPFNTYETRSYTYNTPDLNPLITPIWSAQFFAGFLYDSKNNINTELITINTSINNLQATLNIGANAMIYTTKKFIRNFKIYDDKALMVNGMSTYPVIGWQGGGLSSSIYIPINGKVDMLSPLILEMDTNDEKTIVVGEVWDMGSGYTLTIVSTDSTTALVQLLYNGVQIDIKAVTVGSLYTYTQTVGTQSNVLIFSVYIDAIFVGQTRNLIRLKYAWLASSAYVQIRSSDQYGVMGNASIDATTGTLALRNIYGISLTPDSTQDIMGNLKFRIADSAPILRFYLYISSYVLPIVNITATNMTIPSSCHEPCNVVITWKNTGNTTGGFTPRILLEGPSKALIEYIDPSTNLPEIVPMLPNDIITRTLSLTGVGSGNYSVCPNPN